MVGNNCHKVTIFKDLQHKQWTILNILNVPTICNLMLLQHILHILHHHRRSWIFPGNFAFIFYTTLKATCRRHNGRHGEVYDNARHVRSIHQQFPCFQASVVYFKHKFESIVTQTACLQYKWCSIFSQKYCFYFNNTTPGFVWRCSMTR